MLKFNSYIVVVGIVFSLILESKAVIDVVTVNKTFNVGDSFNLNLLQQNNPELIFYVESIQGGHQIRVKSVELGSAELAALADNSEFIAKSFEYYEHMGNDYEADSDIILSRTSDNLGNFAGNGDLYVGVRRGTGTLDTYGWVKISIPASGDKLTVYEWAHNSVIKEKIKAGQTTEVGIEEYLSSQLNLNLFNHSSFVEIGWNSSIKIKSIDFFSVNGRKLLQLQNVPNSGTKIIDESPGIYFLRISTNQGILSRKIAIN